MIKTFGAIVMTLLTVLSGMTTNDVNQYEQKAQEFYEETQNSMNEEFNEETREELEKKGVIIESVTVHYEKNSNYDNAYTFRADVKVNGHTVSEILVVDMENDDNLEYYGLVDNKLMTADSEEAAYYRELLSTD